MSLELKGASSSASSSNTSLASSFMEAMASTVVRQGVEDWRKTSRQGVAKSCVIIVIICV